VHGPNLHISCARGIAQVHGIHDQDPGQVVGCEQAAQARLAVSQDGRIVDRAACREKAIGRRRHAAALNRDETRKPNRTGISSVRFNTALSLLTCGDAQGNEYSRFDWIY